MVNETKITAENASNRDQLRMEGDYESKSESKTFL